MTMSFGQRFPGVGPDPLFSRIFVLATSVNFLPAALGGEIVEIVVLAALHILFINRIRVAGKFAGAQRAADLDRFIALKGADHSADKSQPSV
jgi:hypothetical protein